LNQINIKSSKQKTNLQTSIMKQQLTLLFLLMQLGLQAQQLKGIIGEDNWLNNWTNFKPAMTEYNETTHILSGVISSDMGTES
jgi:hypothetical protein